jgi:hypothetical protein
MYIDNTILSCKLMSVKTECIATHMRAVSRVPAICMFAGLSQSSQPIIKRMTSTRSRGDKNSAPYFFDSFGQCHFFFVAGAQGTMLCRPCRPVICRLLRCRIAWTLTLLRVYLGPGTFSGRLAPVCCQRCVHSSPAALLVTMSNRLP